MGIYSVYWCKACHYWLVTERLVARYATSGGQRRGGIPSRHGTSPISVHAQARSRYSSMRGFPAASQYYEVLVPTVLSLASTAIQFDAGIFIATQRKDDCKAGLASDQPRV